MFVAAWRHIVTIFHGRGADNVTWLWTINQDRPGTGMRRYRTLGLVWFDKVQHDGIYHQDWRIENDPQADAAFRLGLSELNLARP